MFRSAPPQVPMALMFTGAIPFIASAGIMAVERDDLALQITAAYWMLIYSAIVLSFIGGVRWGAEIAKRERPRFAELGPSVLGALGGWGLVMVGFRYDFPAWVFAAMAGGFALHYIYDSISPELPIWYRRMRLWPTLAVVISLLVAYFLLSGA